MDNPWAAIGVGLLVVLAIPLIIIAIPVAIFLGIVYLFSCLQQ